MKWQTEMLQNILILCLRVCWSLRQAIHWRIGWQWWKDKDRSQLEAQWIRMTWQIYKLSLCTICKHLWPIPKCPSWFSIPLWRSVKSFSKILISFCLMRFPHFVNVKRKIQMQVTFVIRGLFICKFAYSRSKSVYQSQDKRSFPGLLGNFWWNWA